MRVLVVAPHPDDEAVGCGGALHRHAATGDRVEVVFLTSGEAGGHGRGPDETAARRESEAAAAARILGVSAFEFWGAPDGRLRATPALVARLARRLESYRPDVVYVTDRHDAHPDHRAACRLVARALAAGTGTAAPVVLLTEVWTPLRRIDEIVDITDHIDAKLAAVGAYESQCAVLDFAEAFRGLARYRGEMHSWPGGEYAEVFTRLRLP